MTITTNNPIITDGTTTTNTVSDNTIGVYENFYFTGESSEKVDELKDKIETLEDHIADMLLLGDFNELDVYDMNYEQYMELPSDIRL
jgi:hypothetical protein